ncbi:hypothetical protein C8R45DRAFT_455616 [Mycena sanguinolenta]|nr:hypothetical protein C8R45DRAFT_455616 [Mycena sanguinolenta]
MYDLDPEAGAGTQVKRRKGHLASREGTFKFYASTRDIGRSRFSYSLKPDFLLWSHPPSLLAPQHRYDDGRVLAMHHRTATGKEKKLLGNPRPRALTVPVRPSFFCPLSPLPYSDARVRITFPCLYISFLAASWGPSRGSSPARSSPQHSRQGHVAASNWLCNFGIGHATPYLVDPSMKGQPNGVRTSRRGCMRRRRSACASALYDI